MLPWILVSWARGKGLVTLVQFLAWNLQLNSHDKLYTPTFINFGGKGENFGHLSLSTASASVAN